MTSTIDIPAITITKVMKFALYMQADVKPFIEQLDFDPSSENIYNSNIPLAKFCDILGQFEQLHPQGNWSLRFGDSFAFEYLPEMETFLSTAATPREALQVFNWAIPLLAPFLKVEVIEKEQELGVRLDLDTAIPDAIRPIIIEAVISVVYKFGRLLLAHDFQPVLLELKHSLRDRLENYEDYLQTSVQGNCKHTVLWVQADVLDKTLNNHIPQLHQHAEELLQKRLASINMTDNLSRQIYQLMHEDEHFRKTDIDTFAELKHASVRTIQRQLKSEGTSFREIQDKVRLGLASQWLRDPKTSIEDISNRLGFSDRRSFSRSFSRWKGETPSAYRKRHSD